MTRLLPGATIGVLGGGQLGRMLALDARRMGYRVVVLDPDPDSPAAQVADDHVPGALTDIAAALELAARCDVVTLDTEHVPAALLAQLEAAVPVRPGSRVMHAVQDRLHQRNFLTSIGAPQARHAAVHDAASLRAAADFVGAPAVLKTRRSGYDGRGQARVLDPSGFDRAWQDIGRAPAILESFVAFEREVSVLLARDTAGDIRFYPIAENEHRDHVLRTTRVPARVSPDLVDEAYGIASRIADALGHVGMMAVEYFVSREGKLLVNEIAPRTHNSGHYTLGACTTSQFEQHVRAICGLPLADAALLRPAVMLNLLGDLWSSGTPDWTAVLARPSTHLHLYGKARPTQGRKMGHVLVLADDPAQASAHVEAIAATLEHPADHRDTAWT